MAAAKQRIYDVAIVGFGPSGAVAAGLLGAQGIHTYVCDKLRDVYDKPRAIALDHEIIRLFQQMGVAKKIKPYTEPFTDSVYYGVDGQVIKRMSTVAPPYPLGHTPSIVFTQPPAERILREHALSFPSVKVELGQTLTQITQDADRATLTLEGDDGGSTTVQARYVIACDGASSTVRSQVGISLEDLDFDEPWLVVDVLVNEKGLAKLPTTSVQYCKPERPSTYLICPGKHRRWEISINPGEDPQDVATPAGTWKLLAPWLTPADATLWRQASYRFHALVASQWRSGRVFVAGDAAHQQPPFLGQGMCQGVRDVANLCWKLQAVLQAGAPERLLDSYGEERKAHVIDLTTRIKALGQIICERDPVRARDRDARLLAECGGVVQPTPRQDVQPALRAGLLAAQLHPARGTLFPQPWLKAGEGEPRRMDDVLGSGWLLVLDRHADAALCQQARVQARPGLTVVQLGTPGCTETEGVLARWFERQGCMAALVRPDHYVYGVASDAQQLSAQLAALAAF
ncbi:MAG: bifunctional 3-(3-hydroxy-phenyl)propionate/3-hydroxycinnamic acid hydroxylase [Hylemonella sp.]|nr:bifunctional 3-(3-hydroxy-phenyl)propionate/3-hydroxycinnamic acid hydroxylase [Hylemonella sp.]